jgi:hypothetical protein
MLNQVALVSQTDQIALSDLTTVSAALSKQVTRDLGPIWNLEASVDAFDSLDSVPLGYWHVIIMDEIPEDAQGIHLNDDNGQPYAVIQYSDDWSVTTSHETLEMLVDPSGNRTVACNSPDPKQGRVLVLVEVCDPSEGTQFGYTVNSVVVSDFYTPHFFDPVTASGVRYSFSGAITQPLQVLDGGYISWWDPISKHMFQMFVQNGKQQILDRGSVPSGFGTLRSFADSFTNSVRGKLKKKPPKHAMLASRPGMKKAKPTNVDKSVKAHADSLRAQIDRLVHRT